MANTATLVDTIYPSTDITIRNQVYEYAVSIDNVDSDLTIRTPATGNRVFVTGVFFAEGTAGNLSFKSGATANKTITLELAANQGLAIPVGRQWIYVTKVSEALIIRSSAVISGMLLRVAEVAGA